MQHTNFCRQATHHLRHAIPMLRDDEANLAHMAIAEMAEAEKFLLPDGGRIFEDPDLKNLDRDMPLHLPYPVIALEYQMTVGRKVDRATQTPSSKRIAVAYESEHSIYVMPVYYMDDFNAWAVLPSAAIPRNDYIFSKPNGALMFRLKLPPGIYQLMAQDYTDEIAAVLSLLNVLACGNVRTEVSRPNRRTPKGRGHNKNRLPFDSYHILTIDPSAEHADNEPQSGTHASPREHLRRGHYRVRNGKRFWVNATVVNPGIGRVEKTYKLRPEAPTP